MDSEHRMIQSGSANTPPYMYPVRCCNECSGPASNREVECGRPPGSESIRTYRLKGGGSSGEDVYFGR